MHIHRNSHYSILLHWQENILVENDFAMSTLSK
jgi:hypothetical protein